MRRVWRIARELESKINLDGAADLVAAAVVERPTPILRLSRAQVAGHFRLQNIVEFVHVMHHEDVFRRNRAIGLQLEAPVTVFMLMLDQSVRRALNDALQRIEELTS